MTATRPGASTAQTSTRQTTNSHAPGRVSTRDRIVTTAAELFATNGYHATGITEILDAVALSRGTFYYHVDSKDDLLYEISLNQVTRMNEVADAILRQEHEPADAVRELARSLVRNIADHSAEWTVFFREFNALQGERRDHILDARDAYETKWRSVLEEGMADGTFRPVSSLHVKGILGMLNYTYLWINPNGRLNAEQIADGFIDLLLDGLRTK